MKMLGLVAWTNRDKNGNAIAGVRPLVELQKNEWRTIDAMEEFPTQGQVFWWNAQSASQDSLIYFRAEPNPPGQKDAFKVVDPKPIYEVLNLQQHGTPIEVRTALVEGIHLPGSPGNMRVFVWCKADLLVGPVELNRVNGMAKLVVKNLQRLATYTGTVIRRVIVDQIERLVRVDEATPSGYVDWDDDAAVLRRALDVAVRVAKQSGDDTGQTKKQIDEAARTLAVQGIGIDAQLDRYRLERARALLENTDLVAQIATTISEALREHPSIKESLNELRAKVRVDVEQSVRAELERRLATERAALTETINTHARMKLEVEASEQKLRNFEGQFAEVRNRLEGVAREAEVAVNTRVLAAIDRPLELLAEVSVLRPFLGSNGTHSATTPTAQSSTRLDWSSTRSDEIKDKAALRRILTSFARERGVDPSLMLQIHAAIAAQLMPTTLGPGAFGALTAYAQGACGGRLLVVHVSPSAIQPHEFDEIPGGGLKAAAVAANDINGVSLVILEGANRSPLEASLVPLLLLMEAGLSPLSAARGLRLAASLVAGATTVPVTPQLWSHAVAIYPEPSSPSAQTGAPGDIALSSELFALGDEPTGVIDEMLETWPDCRELRPSLSRFGSALTRIYDEESRVTDALLNGLILPYIATSFSVEEQADVLSNSGDQDGAIALALRRLRRRLA